MDIQQARQLAQDETTTPELLIELARSEDYQTRKYVAINSNTPITTLEKLGAEFPEEITDNPILNLLLLEKPDSKFVRLSLARSSTTELKTLENLAALEEEDILCAIARNISTPIHVLEKLADWEQAYTEDGERFITKVPAYVATNPNIPPVILDKLANHNESYVRQIVAENKNTLSTTLEKLAQKNPKHVLLKVGQNINTPVSALERLAGEKDREIRDVVIAHSHVSDMAIKIIEFMEEKSGTSEDILEKLSTDSRLHVQQMVAEHPLCPPQVLKQLSDHNDYMIIYSVSSHPNTQSDILEKLTLKLVKSDKQNKRILKAERGNVNYRIIYLNLFNHPHNTIFAKLQIITLELYESIEEIAKSKSTPDQVLNELAKQVLNKIDKYLNSDRVNKKYEDISNQKVLTSILNNCNTSAETISSVFYKIDSNIKYNIFDYFKLIAEHPNTPSWVLDKMSADERYKRSHYQIARHPNTTLIVLRELCNHNNQSINTYHGYSLVRNPNTPSDILLDIISKYDWGVRIDLAKFNNKIPDDILKILIDDKRLYVQSALATNSCLPISVIERFAESEIDIIREGISKNTKTPDYILDILANEPNINIRLNVAKHQNTSEKTLFKLAKSTDESTKAELSKREPINLNIIKILIKDIETNIIADRDHRFTIMNQIAKCSEVPDYLLEKVASCILLDCIFTSSGLLFLVEKSLVFNQNTPLSVLYDISQNKRDYSGYGTIQRLALRNIKAK